MNPAYKGCRLLFLILLIISFFWGVSNDRDTVYAHPLNNGYSYLNVGLNAVDYELFVPEQSLLGFDVDGNGRVLGNDLNERREQLTSYLSEHVRLIQQAEPMRMTLKEMEPAEKDAVSGVTFRMRFETDAPVSGFTIEYGLLFDDVDPLHLNFALIEQGDDLDQAVLDREHRTYAYAALHPAGWGTVLWTYFKLGVLHIWTGYDHLLFLFSLLLAVRRWADAAWIVTAFTAAHSATLILAAVGLLSLPPIGVETAIALSICYVAAENLGMTRPGLRRRLLMTLGFGLIHGVGFAGALEEVGLPRAYFNSSLVSFNVGVEAGQLGVVTLLLPAWLKLARTEKARRTVTIAGSLLVLGLAAYWALERGGLIAGR